MLGLFVFVLGKAMVKYDKGIHASPCVLTYYSTNLLTIRRGVSGVKSGVGMLHVFRCMILLGNEIIGACFQAPHAAPGQ